MSVESLIQLCSQYGIKLSLSGDGSERLLVDAPKGALTPSLREALTANKAELIVALRTRAKAESSTDTDTQTVTHVETSKPLASEPTLPAERKANSDQLFTPPNRFERAGAEVKNLLAGRNYDAQIIEA